MEAVLSCQECPPRSTCPVSLPPSSNPPLTTELVPPQLAIIEPGPWYPDRLGPMLVVAGQALELFILAFTLIVVTQGMKSPDLDFQAYKRKSPLSRGGVLLVLFGSICTAHSISCCRRLPDAKAADRAHVIRACLVSVYVLRLFLGFLLVGPGADHEPYLSDEAYWEEWWYWGGLIQRWVTEGLMVLLLATYVRYIGDKRHQLLLTCLVVVLVMEVLLQIGVACGAFAGGQAQLANVLGVEGKWAGTILLAPMLLLRLLVLHLLLSLWIGLLSPPLLRENDTIRDV